MKKYNLVIVGASGLVGRTMLEVLEERNFPINKILLLASSRSAGQKVSFMGRELEIQELEEDSFKSYELALFSAGAGVSEKYAPLAVKAGLCVIDNSSFWRQKEGIPLVVPEVNSYLLKDYKGIIANPNCSTIQCMPALKILRDMYGLERVIYSTYQAAAGAGMKGLADLENNSCQTFDYPLQKNVLVRIDSFMDNGYTKEEWKMIEESRKILDLPDLAVTATAVRVPVDYAHSVSINVELKKDFDLADIREAFEKEDSLVVKDEPDKLLYPMPLDAKHNDKIYVGRIRRDFSRPNTLNLWCVADNIRKGAATNSVQIAEAWIKNRE